MDHKTDKFWFLCEPILVRAAWHAERGVSEKWTRLCYPIQGASSTSSVLQLQCPEAEAIQHALTTTPNGAHPPPPSQFIAHHQMGWGSKASTAELTLAVSSDLDDALTDLLSYMTLLFMSWTVTRLVYVKSLQRWKNEYKWLKRGEEDLQKERWWIWACVYFWWQWWWAKSNVCKGSLLQSGERQNSRLEDLKR